MDQDQTIALEDAIENALHANIEGLHDWDKIKTAIVTAIGENSFYSIRAEREYHDRDRDNYHRSRVVSWETLRAETEEALYEKMAGYKVRNETPEPKRGYEYHTVEFGAIEHHLGSLDWYDPREPIAARIEQTPTWKAHEEKQAAERAEAERLAALAAEAAASKAQDAERAMLVALLAKHGVPK